MMQYPLSPIQSQSGYANIVSATSQSNTLSANSPVSMSTSPYVGSHYHPLPGMQFPLTYPGMMNHQHLSQATTLTNGSAVNSSLSGSAGSQIEGTKCFNLH